MKGLCSRCGSSGEGHLLHKYLVIRTDFTFGYDYFTGTISEYVGRCLLEQGGPMAAGRRCRVFFLDKAEVGVQQMGLLLGKLLWVLLPAPGGPLPHLTTLSTVFFPLPSVSGGLASDTRTYYYTGVFGITPPMASTEGVSGSGISRGYRLEDELGALGQCPV